MHPFLNSLRKKIGIILAAGNKGVCRSFKTAKVFNTRTGWWGKCCTLKSSAFEFLNLTLKTSEASGIGLGQWAKRSFAAAGGGILDGLRGGKPLSHYSAFSSHGLFKMTSLSVGVSK